MADLPISVRISLFFGVFAVVGLAWTQAQRLGEVRSKPLSRLLGGLAFFGSIAWIEFGCWLFFRLDLHAELPKTFWMISGFAFAAIAIWASRNGWFTATQTMLSTKAAAGLAILFATMEKDSYYEPGECRFSIFLRSDFEKPVGIQFTGFQNRLSEDGPVRIGTGLIRFLGLRIEGSPTERIAGPGRYGAQKIVVKPHDVLRVSVDVRHWITPHPPWTDRAILDRLPLGVLTFLIEKQEVSFPLNYGDIRPPDLIVPDHDGTIHFPKSAADRALRPREELRSELPTPRPPESTRHEIRPASIAGVTRKLR